MNDTFVRLKSASLSFAGGAGELHSYLNVLVKVKNVEYWKDVQLHYKRRYGSGWEDTPLKWRVNYRNYDLFILEPTLDFGSDPLVEFVINYTSGGRTYWDNNNFANYHLFTGITSLISSNNVMLNLAELIYGGTPGSSYITGVRGEILVNNLSYHKKVGIRYSNDGWKSYSDLDAIYKESLGGSVETWFFGLNLTPEAFTIGQFAVYYQNMETGQWYWDNNFGQNYRLSESGFLKLE